MEKSPSRSPRGIVVPDVAPTPGPVRRAVGWLLIVVSPVFCVFPLVDLYLREDQLSPSVTHLSTLVLGWLFAAFTAAFLCGGIGLVRDRTTLVRIGGWLFVGTFTTYYTLFLIWHS